MMTPWKRLVLLPCLLLSILPASPAWAEEALKSYTSPDGRLSFHYPAKFTLGKYTEQTPPAPEEVILVEPALVRSANLQALPVGQVSALHVSLATGDKARFLRQLDRFFGGHEEVKGGPYPIYRYPGYPGPYGDQAYYYIVPISKNAAVEAYGHRYRFGPSHPDTREASHYDQDLEALLKSLMVKERGK